MMKKFLVALAAAGALSVVADELVQAEPVAVVVVEQPAYLTYPKTIFQVGIFPGFPDGMMKSQVFGIKSGWPMCGGYGSINGLEASWLSSATDYIKGIQASWVFCMNRELMGLEASLGLCLNMDRGQGLLAAPAFTMSGDFKGVQASSINISKDYVGWQPAAILNVSSAMKGWQLSVITNVAADVTGAQTSLINVADNVNGFQLGLINQSTSGLQFGLLNFNEKGFLPVFPFINF